MDATCVARPPFRLMSFASGTFHNEPISTRHNPEWPVHVGNAAGEAGSVGNTKRACKAADTGSRQVRGCAR